MPEPTTGASSAHIVAHVLGRSDVDLRLPLSTPIFNILETLLRKRFFKSQMYSYLKQELELKKKKYPNITVDGKEEEEQLLANPP